jgi:hypothetical protein
MVPFLYFRPTILKERILEAQDQYYLLPQRRLNSQKWESTSIINCAGECARDSTWPWIRRHVKAGRRRLSRSQREAESLKQQVGFEPHFLELYDICWDCGDQRDSTSVDGHPVS